MKIISFLLGLFGSGAGQQTGRAVANVASIAALLPLLVYIHKNIGPDILANLDKPLTCVSWGDAILWGLIGVGVVKIVHYTNPRRESSSV